jgi:peptidoglycan/LPS O-acetylase OafA/YrhL
VTVGGMCYTFYLYHLLVIKTCAKFLDAWASHLGYFPAFLLYLVVIGTVNWMICSALFILFERPFMKWRPQRGKLFNGLIPARIDSGMPVRRKE